jgi:hypothetical protein
LDKFTLSWFVLLTVKDIILERNDAREEEWVEAQLKGQILISSEDCCIFIWEVLLLAIFDEEQEQHPMKCSSRAFTKDDVQNIEFNREFIKESNWDTVYNREVEWGKEYNIAFDNSENGAGETWNEELLPDLISNL